MSTGTGGHLLAVDAGLRCGLAFYSQTDTLTWYRSSNFGSLSRLRQAVYTILRELPDNTVVVLEGGGQIADIWESASRRRGFEFIKISAEKWRALLMFPKQKRTGSEAKRTADTIARRVIKWAGAPKPTSLRHDAAEAILIGLWAIKELRWINCIPKQIAQ